MHEWKQKLQRIWRDRKVEVIYYGICIGVYGGCAIALRRAFAGKDIVGAELWEVKEGEKANLLIFLKNGNNVILPFVWDKEVK